MTITHNAINVSAGRNALIFVSATATSGQATPSACRNVSHFEQRQVPRRPDRRQVERAHVVAKHVGSKTVDEADLVSGAVAGISEKLADRVEALVLII